MILAIYRNEFNRLAQDFQRIVQLDAFTDRHIRIHSAMQQQQRSLYLVCIEQRAMLGEQIGIVPRIAFCSRNGVIGISPETFAPIACHIADTGM